MKVPRSKSGRRFTAVALFFIFYSIRVSPQENNGHIDVRVTRQNSLEGISNARVVLQGPYPTVTPAMLSRFYTPNSALTPEMKEQVESLIASAPPDVTVEVIANEARRLEARFLGLPLPLQNAGSTPPPEVSVLTNSSGRHSFERLQPGFYRISAQRDGYFGALPPGGLETEPAIAATATAIVEAVQTMPELRLTLLLRGTVSGNVRNSKGSPVTDARVSAYRMEYQNLRTVLQQVNSSSTDDRGDYRLFPLPPGNYYIGVTPGFRDPSGRFQSASTQTFHPDAIDVRSARRVEVTEGGESAGVDIGIRTSTSNLISGNSVNPFGLVGLVSGRFYLLPTDADSISITEAPNTAADRTNGYFEFRGVAPGTYELVASKVDRLTGGTAIGRTRIDIGTEDLENVVVNIQPDVEVKARLIVDGGRPQFTMVPPLESGLGLATREDGSDIPMAFAPPTFDGLAAVKNSLATLFMGGLVRHSGRATGLVPYPKIRMELKSMEFGDYLANFGTLYPAVDPSGVFTFTSVPPGHYRIKTINLPEDAYVVDMRIGEKSVYDEGFAAETSMGEVEVIVNSKGAQIQGTVRDAQNKPFAFAKIALVPTLPRRQNIALFKTALSDVIGSFTLRGIAPGDYKVFAWDPTPSNLLLNSDFINQHESQAETITVSDGGRITADLKMMQIN